MFDKYVLDNKKTMHWIKYFNVYARMNITKKICLVQYLHFIIR